jgi:hypothetical protein
MARKTEGLCEVYLRETALAFQWYIRESRRNVGQRSPRVSPCILRVVCLLGIAVGAGLASADEPATAEQIADWIETLGSPQFSQREAATRSLIEAGPTVLSPLQDAISSGDLEVSSRAIEIARSMLGSADQNVADAAEQFLDAAATADDASVAELAEATLDFHAVGMADAALVTLQQLGMKLTRGMLTTGQQGMQATFDVGWKGSSDDMRMLLRLPGVLIVSVYGVAIDEKGLEVIGRLRRAGRIELYGTGLDETQVARLAEKLPDTHIELRKGGKLGVAGNPNVVPCHITMVQPGSAADKAGLQIGDIVVKIADKPIRNFEELTTEIGRHAPGEKLTIEIVRGLPGDPEQRMTRIVALDAW